MDSWSVLLVAVFAVIWIPIANTCKAKFETCNVVRISVYTPTIPMPVQRREETVECAQADSASNSSEPTLPYGLAERLAGLDLLNTAETQSSFANAGSMHAHPEEERVEKARPEKGLLSEPDQQFLRDETAREIIPVTSEDRDQRAPTREVTQEQMISSGEWVLELSAQDCQPGRQNSSGEQVPTQVTHVE